LAAADTIAAGSRESCAGGVGVLTSHASHAEAVTTVRGDGDLDYLIGQSEQFRSHRPPGSVGCIVLAQEFLEHDDAVNGISA